MKTPQASMNRAERRARTWLIKKAGARLILERAVPAILLLKVVDVCLQNPEIPEKEDAFFRSMFPLLVDATTEGMASISDRDYPEAVHAVSWVCFHAFACGDAGRASGTLFLASIFWLQAILASDYLVLSPGSSFDKAATALIEDMERFERGQPDVFGKMEKAARKLAKGMQARLEALGLFRGALVAEAA